MPTTQVGSHTVYYDDCGAGHPVLFMSGLGSTRWAGGSTRAFSAKFRAINMDNRDAGDSALGTGSYTIADMSEDTAGVIQNLKLGPTHVLASRWAHDAQELAIRHPELVDKLVLFRRRRRPDLCQRKPEIAAC